MSDTLPRRPEIKKEDQDPLDYIAKRCGIPPAVERAKMAKGKLQECISSAFNAITNLEQLARRPTADFREQLAQRELEDAHALHEQLKREVRNKSSKDR